MCGAVRGAEMLLQSSELKSATVEAAQQGTMTMSMSKLEIKSIKPKLNNDELN